MIVTLLNMATGAILAQRDLLTPEIIIEFMGSTPPASTNQMKKLHAIFLHEPLLGLVFSLLVFLQKTHPIPVVHVGDVGNDLTHTHETHNLLWVSCVCVKSFSGGAVSEGPICSLDVRTQNP